MSRIFGVVVWQFMCDNFGDFEMMSAQFVPKERIAAAFVGVLGLLGNGY